MPGGGSDGPPGLAAQHNMLNKLKPILITAAIAIAAVALFNRFAPQGLKELVYGAA
jgi:hypothetical protein